MNDVKAAIQVRGRAIGALFFAGFGELWVLLALYALQRLGLPPSPELRWWR